jgi:hypothetical protein
MALSYVFANEKVSVDKSRNTGVQIVLGLCFLLVDGIYEGSIQMKSFFLIKVSLDN